MASTRDMIEKFVKNNPECTSKNIKNHLESKDKNISMDSIRQTLRNLYSKWKTISRRWKDGKYLYKEA